MQLPQRLGGQILESDTVIAWTSAQHARNVERDAGIMLDRSERLEFRQGGDVDMHALVFPVRRTPDTGIRMVWADVHDRHFTMTDAEVLHLGDVILQTGDGETVLPRLPWNSR